MSNVTKLPEKTMGYCFLYVIHSDQIKQIREAIKAQGFSMSHDICLSVDGEVKTFSIEEFKEKLGFKTT